MNPFESQYTDQISALLTLHEKGSFISAGKALQRHHTIISKRLAELETRLGVRLVERTPGVCGLLKLALSMCSTCRMHAMS